MTQSLRKKIRLKLANGAVPAIYATQYGEDFVMVKPAILITDEEAIIVNSDESEECGDNWNWLLSNGWVAFLFMEWDQICDRATSEADLLNAYYEKGLQTENTWFTKELRGMLWRMTSECRGD